MINAERTVEDSVALLKVPEPYQLQVKQPKGGSDDTSGGDSGNVGGSGRGTGGGIDASVPHNPVPPMPGQDATLPDGGAGSGAGSVGGISGGSVSGGGPDLAGVITPGQPAPIMPGAGDAVGLPGGGGGGALPVTGGGGTVNPLVPGLMPTGGGGGTIPPAGRVPRTGVRPAASPSRLPSGVIGEPAAGRAGAAGMAPGRAGAAGMAPGRAGAGGRGRSTGRGGIIGAEEEGVGGRGAAGRGGRVPRPSWLSDDPVGPDRHARSATGGLAGAPGRSGRRARGEDDTIGFDPDNPWQVAEGVDPVITPAPDTARHDPGPNVIGWNG
jgi:hypothetical protein